MLKQDDYIRGHLVSMGWRFGQSYGGGHLAGQMVMHAIANRVRQGWGTWLQVIDNIPTFMAEKEMPPLIHGSVWDPAFVKLLHSVDGVHDGSAPDLSKGGLFWGDLIRIERQWFKEMIAAGNPLTGGRQHNRIACMNGLNFWD